MTGNPSTRMYWLDSAKGIGVILINVGHLLYTGDVPWVNKLIYSFHMPMFFLFAGYTFRVSSERFVRKKAKRLLLPFVAYAAISMPLFALVHYNEILENVDGGGHI